MGVLMDDDVHIVEEEDEEDTNEYQEEDEEMEEDYEYGSEDVEEIDSVCTETTCTTNHTN